MYSENLLWFSENESVTSRKERSFMAKKLSIAHCNFNKRLNIFTLADVGSSIEPIFSM